MSADSSDDRPSTEMDPVEEALQARVDRAARRNGLGSLAEFKRIQSGASSLTFEGTFRDIPGESMIRAVVKAAPAGLAPVRNRDVLRQAHIIETLAEVAEIAVPRVLLKDAGQPPDQPPFFVMSYEVGESIEPIFLRDGPLPGPVTLRNRVLASARMLGALHRIDPGLLVLGGEPAIEPAEELARWTKAFSTVDDDLRPGAEDVGALLLENIPRGCPPRILHGDYRLGNLLCHGEHIAAIIDWEIWAVGDPRMDLAWLLLHRDPADNPHGDRVAPGMPSSDEVISAYQDAAVGEIGDLAWFHALVRYKQAAAGALIVKHNRKSANPDPRREGTAALLGPQLASAAAFLRY